VQGRDRVGRKVLVEVNIGKGPTNMGEGKRRSAKGMLLKENRI